VNHFLAQIPQDVGVTFARTIFEFGVAGTMLWWFATRNETKLRELGSKIDDNTWATVMMAKTQLISLVAIGQLDSAVKRQAEGLLSEINQKYPTDRIMGERHSK
jgi:hypothetical protein